MGEARFRDLPAGRVPGGLRPLRKHPARARAGGDPGLGQRRRAGRPAPLGLPGSRAMRLRRAVHRMPVLDGGGHGAFGGWTPDTLGQAGRPATGRGPAAAAARAAPTGTRWRARARAWPAWCGSTSTATAGSTARRRGERLLRGRRREQGTRPRPGAGAHGPGAAGPRVRPQHGQPGAGPPRRRLLVVAAAQRPTPGRRRARADVVDRAPPVGRPVGRAAERDGAARTPSAGIPTHRLRYEDLVSDPRGAVTGLLDDLGLSLPADGLAHLEEHAVTLGSQPRAVRQPEQVHPRADRAPRRRRVAPSACRSRERRLVTATHAAVAGGLRLPARAPRCRATRAATRAETP